MLLQLNSEQLVEYIKDDPVRPHIPIEWRLSFGREVYGLFDNNKDVKAIICVAYTDDVPTCEEDLDDYGSSVAVFYTVWSYSRGSGREIVSNVANTIKDTNSQIKRYVTLSPLTTMAERFHLANGAKFIGTHTTCQNFEYIL